jgi:hypothetical protein
MTARAPLRKLAPREKRRAAARPAFHPPANDNSPVMSRRLLAWVLMALGFAAMAIVLATGA